MVQERTAGHTSGMRRAYPIVVAISLAALTALMLFATPVAAGDSEDAKAASAAGNYEEASRLWKKLAEQGNADAQFNLGNMYQGGRRVPTNYTKYTYWYRKADGQDAG